MDVKLMDVKLMDVKLMDVKLIVAMCKNNGIGCHNKIPWRISEDMNYFFKKTSGNYGMIMRNKNSKENYTEDLNNSRIFKKNAVIMGRNTWESLPKKYKPLPHRVNIILSKSVKKQEEDGLNGDIVFSSSVDDAMSLLCNGPEQDDGCEKGEKGEKKHINHIWIIGGSSVYKEFMIRNMKNTIKISKYYITYIDKHYDCDTYFPILENMNKYYLTHFEKHICIDNNTPNETPLNVYFIVFKKIEYTDEKIIEQLFTSYKSKDESRNSLTLYIKNVDTDTDTSKSKVNIKNTYDFEILFSMFCS